MRSCWRKAEARKRGSIQCRSRWAARGSKQSPSSTNPTTSASPFPVVVVVVAVVVVIVVVVEDEDGTIFPG